MRIMRGIFSLLAGLLILIVAASSQAVADNQVADIPRAMADGETGYLMLKDGGLLEGKITRAADWYIVGRAGGEMQVAQSRVLLACRTLEEAYAFRRQQISGTKPEPHLDLAEWCLRYNLLADAGRELADAGQLDSDHPRLALLERRLAKMNSQPATKTAAAVKAQQRSANPPAAASAVSVDVPDGVVERFTRKVQPVLVNNCT